MDKTIIDIIDKKAMRQYRGMTETKKKAYRAMLYAGTQVTLNGYSVRDVALEIGYSESGTSKLVQKWIELMRNGNVTVNLIITATQKLPMNKRFQPHVKNVSPEINDCMDSVNEISTKSNSDTPVISTNTTLNKKNKIEKVLGFVITPEDKKRKRKAIRSSILFFQSYGKGAKPRMNGEYFSPGTNPAKKLIVEDSWLPLNTAALYCGCKEDVINAAGQNGTIERRVYRRNANRYYYEYKVTDLNRFILDNHLL